MEIMRYVETIDLEVGELVSLKNIVSHAKVEVSHLPLTDLCQLPKEFHTI